MRSEVLVGARVLATEGERRESDSVSPFSAPKICAWSSIVSERGISCASESYSQIKKTDTELYRLNNLLSRLETEESSRELDHGIINGSTASISGSEGKNIQRKVGKVQRNGNCAFKKLRISQADNLLVQIEADDSKTESHKLGLQPVKCSNADNSQVDKQKNAINGRRSDKRNSKVPVKAKYDSFLPRAGFPTFSPPSGGSNAFGMHVLKPDVHDITKLIDDISLDELLDGSCTFFNLGKETGNKAANMNENILDSVMKACSILWLQGLQQNKHTEEIDVHVDKKIPLLSCPSNTNAADSPDGDQSSLAAGLSKCSKDQKSCMRAKPPPADMYNSTSLDQPIDIFERLALPPKDLESLLEKEVKPAPSLKLASCSPKPLSTHVSLPPFSWSHSFNGHHKSNNDGIKALNRNTCQGRWARIKSAASSIRVDTDSSMDLDSLTYDDSLVPPGKLKYRLPEIKRSSFTVDHRHCSQHNLTSAECPTVPQPPSALHCPRLVAAARTLYDMATHISKPNSDVTLKWPKQSSQKAMKPRKSRSSKKPKPEEAFLTPKSETTHSYKARRGEHRSTSTKKAKLSVVQTRQDFSHIQTVIGLTSVCALRSSSKSSPLKFSKDSVIEPPFTIISPHNKVRKVAQMD